MLALIYLLDENSVCCFWYIFYIIDDDLLVYEKDFAANIIIFESCLGKYAIFYFSISLTIV